MEIKCPKCNHSWDYKGDGEYYLTCPHCYRKINIKKLKGGIENGRKIRN